MSMLLSLANALSITAIAKEAGIHLNTSPFLGGQGHNALLRLEDPIPGTGVISIDGSDLVQDTAPAAADASWTSLATLQAGSPAEQEITLPVWIRVNITASNASGTATINLQGIQ